MDFEDFEEEDDDRDYCAEMIAWLAERDPDVWFASTLRPPTVAIRARKP